MLHNSFSNLLLLTVSRASMYLIISLNFLATHSSFSSKFSYTSTCNEKGTGLPARVHNLFL